MFDNDLFNGLCLNAFNIGPPATGFLGNQPAIYLANSKSRAKKISLPIAELRGAEFNQKDLGWQGLVFKLVWRS